MQNISLSKSVLAGHSWGCLCSQCSALRSDISCTDTWWVLPEVSASRMTPSPFCCCIPGSLTGSLQVRGRGLRRRGRVPGCKTSSLSSKSSSSLLSLESSSLPDGQTLRVWGEQVHRGQAAGVHTGLWLAGHEASDWPGTGEDTGHGLLAPIQQFLRNEKHFIDSVTCQRRVSREFDSSLRLVLCCFRQDPLNPNLFIYLFNINLSIYLFIYLIYI